MVIQAAYRVTGRAEDAEDVLQTVFMRLIKRDNLPDLSEGSGPYLRRAAVNAALDIVRSRKAASVPLESVVDFLVDRGEQRPDQVRSAAELRGWLREAVSRLNDRAAEIFTLRFIEGASNQEIADLLETSPGTVAVTIHRVRTQLQASLQSFLGGMQ